MKATKLIKKIVNKKISEIHVALPAKIKEYDPEEMIASVTLLAKKELEGENVVVPPIIEVPVAHFNAGPFVIRPPYQKDDVVQVMFNERALDKILITGDPEDVEYKRKHALDDAVVVKGLKAEQEDSLPSEEPNSLYICNLDQDVKIVMNPDGTIRIADDKNGTELKFDAANAGDAIFTLASKLFLGSSGASEGVPLGNSLKNWLDSHQHPGDSGGVTGSPTSSSPDPSSKVMVE